MRSSFLTLIGLALTSNPGANGHPWNDDVESQSVTILKFLDKLPDWDPEHRHKLELGFDNAIDLAKYAMWELQPPNQPLNKNSKILKKYFKPDDAQIVLDVFKSLLSANTLGNDRLKEVHFSNLDPSANCDSPSEPVKPGTIAMYTTPWTLHKPEQASFIFVCPIVWQLGYPRSIHDIKCEETCADFGAKKCWPSARMASIGELILHELIHRTSAIADRPKGIERTIVDQMMADPDKKVQDGVPAYDTYRTQQLIKGPDKDKARYNADSYSMFAREVWFTRNCPGIVYKDPDHWESSIPNNLKPKPHSDEAEDL